MRHNNHKFLKNTKAQKFGLERGEWCKYSAFAEMSNSIETYLIDSNVATKPDTPVWMDKDGNVTTGDDAFGCKVTIIINILKQHFYFHSSQVTSMICWPVNAIFL